MSRTITVMQPYLYPYAGYFRLLAVSEVFVIFDDVQFVRRGRVHRCEVGPGQWLTLPLKRQPRDILINELEFAPGARASFDQRLMLARIPRNSADPDAAAVCDHLYGPLDSVVDFLEAGLRLVSRALQLNVEIVRSSSLAVSGKLRAQSKVISIVKGLGGICYVNAPGGHALYDSAAFAAAGIELKFLPRYGGGFRYLLPALLDRGLPGMRQEMRGFELES